MSFPNFGREKKPDNPGYGGCDCDCHIKGMVVMHCVPCCYPRDEDDHVEAPLPADEPGAA